MDECAKHKEYYEDRAYLADSSFFRIFSFPLLHGDPAQALAQGNAVVITREKALKYFGQENALGKRLEVNGTSYLVTGVMEDIPSNGHFKPEVVSSLALLRSQGFMQNWHANILHTYIKIAEGVSPQALEQKISKVADRYVGDQIRANNQTYTYFLQPITAIHLHSDLRYELEANSRLVYVQIFSGNKISALRRSRCSCWRCAAAANWRKSLRLIKASFCNIPTFFRRRYRTACLVAAFPII
ncbi:ABC transporter permease [candidate division KSB1 bacterium]|nr:ABC transporter permease [candidate division KSB1 bacterium]